jgi:regulator of sigma D
VYTTDRSKKTAVKPVNCRQLKTFVQAYVDFSEASPAAVFDKVLSNHIDYMNEGASSHDKFNLAETVLRRNGLWEFN